VLYAVAQILFFRYITFMQQQNGVLRVLGIDPGLASTGWGIVDFYQNRFKMIAYGVIETSADAPRGERLSAIYSRITNILMEFHPAEAGMETLYFAKNVSSAMAVAEARGVVTLCLSQNCVLLGEYTPIVIKQSVSGCATADKKLVQNFVKMLLGLEDIPKPDHAADALAAAITHINIRRV
jgi:crossover junction endodeoxyribonuclease RuvC